MNNDLISREDLIKAIKVEFDYASATGFSRKMANIKSIDLICMIFRLIDNAPTVEPEITEKQAILLLINNGWLVNHDKELREKWEKPQGRWKLVERDNQDIDVVCPFCNRTRFLAYSHGYTIEELEEHLIRQHLPNFCENCGADMRGEKE